MPFISNQDGGDPNATDPSQPYINVYTPTEDGQGYMSQQRNPAYDWKTVDDQYADWYNNTPEGQAHKAQENATRWKSHGFFRDAASGIWDNKEKIAAMTGGAATLGLGTPALMAAMTAEGAGTVGGLGALTAAEGAGAATGAGEVGSFLTGASAPGFATTGTLAGEAGFGGATYGAAAPATLTGMTGAALPAAATSGATSGIAKLAEAMGINKAAEMLGMEPSTLGKLIGGLGTAAIAAAASRNKGQSAPLAQTGFQGQIDPNKLKYVGNNQYIPNPVVKAAAGGGISGLGMALLAEQGLKFIG